jgi:hypothetical protein
MYLLPDSVVAVIVEKSKATRGLVMRRAGVLVRSDESVADARVLDEHPVHQADVGFVGDGGDGHDRPSTTHRILSEGSGHQAFHHGCAEDSEGILRLSPFSWRSQQQAVVEQPVLQQMSVHHWRSADAGIGGNG